MAQIIKHRRGSLESLSAVTSSLQKGELVIASGSSNLSVTNGASIVFAVPENGQVQAVNRVLVGANAPNTFAAGTYNGMMKGVPYYASGSSTLYLLGEGANEIPNLVGNISEYSSSVSASLSALSASIGSGNIGSSVTQLNTFSASVLTRLTEIGVVSGSLITSASAAKARIDSLSGFTGSYATTGSNVFYGTQTISGSVNVSGSTNFNGAVAVDNSNMNLGNSSSLNLTGGSSIYVAAEGVISGSIVGIGNVTAFSTSVDSRLSNLQSKSASVDTAIAALNSYTSSNTSTTALNAFTASAAEKFTEIGVVSGSLITSASAAKSKNDAQDGRLNNLESTSASVNTSLTELNSYSSSLKQAFTASGTSVTFSGDVTIPGNFIVRGTQTIVDSTTVQLGDNIIELNGSAAANGGLYVKDVTNPNTATGSIIWDSTNDYWKAGAKDSESKVLLAGGDSVVSGSSQITISNTTGYSDFSGSISASFAEVIANVGSGVGVSITNLNSFSSSTLGRLTNIESFSSSVETRLTEIGVVSGSLILSASAAAVANANQNLFTQSADGRLTNLESTSASVNISVSNLNSTTASLNISVSNLNSTTASLNTSVAALNSSSASQQISIDALNNVSGSNLGRLSNLETTSASVNISIAALNSYTSSNTSTNALNAFTASAGGRLDNLETTSASVNTSVSNLNSFSSSVLTQLTEVGVVTASLFSSASSAKSTNDTQDGRLSNLENKSASVDTSISNINSFTASFGTTFSSSVDSRLDTLEGTGTIQGVGTSNNVTFAKVTTTGDVVVGGDLVVQGNTVTLNTATLVVEDKLITLASGSTSSATADGSGFEVAGANANFVYQHSTTSFTSSVALIAPAVTASINLGTTAGSSKRIAFRNTNGNLDLVPTASVAGDLLQWDGNDFVMSNVIDGGSF
jgi:uncharacterized coiled-coil protein SlyX